MGFRFSFSAFLRQHEDRILEHIDGQTRESTKSLNHGHSHLHHKLIKPGTAVAYKQRNISQHCHIRSI